MNIKKNIIALAIIGTTSLFATNLTEVNTLVDKILNTKDKIVKQELIIELNKEVNKMDTKTATEAQTIINTKLKTVK